jgi:hypothetical protein
MVELPKYDGLTASDTWGSQLLHPTLSAPDVLVRLMADAIVYERLGIH